MLADVGRTNPWARRTPPDRRGRKSLAGSSTGTWGELLLTPGASSEWRRLMIVCKIKKNFSASMEVDPQMMREITGDLLVPASHLFHHCVFQPLREKLRLQWSTGMERRSEPFEAFSNGHIAGTTGSVPLGFLERLQAMAQIDAVGPGGEALFGL
jgi:hypothetical protein